jgi:hypothetical protein
LDGGPTWAQRGHNRKSLADLQLTGQFRPGRHRHLLTAPPPPEPVFDWQPTPEERASLGSDGQRFLADALQKWAFNFVAGRLLLMMAQTLDMMGTLRDDISARGVVLTGRNGATKVNPAVKEHLRSLRWFGQLAKQLDLSRF